MNRKQRRTLFRKWAHAKRMTWLELPSLIGRRFPPAAALIPSNFDPIPERSGDLDHRDRDHRPGRDDPRPRRQPGPRFRAA